MTSTNTHFSPKARRWAAVVGFTTLAVLVLRLYLSALDLGGVGTALLELSRFFTILTNALVMLVMLQVAYSSKPASASLVSAIVMSIIGVGLVYHALLAHLWEPQGLELLADHCVHTVVPLMSFAWWLVFIDKKALNFKQPLVWALWPVAYSLFTLVRSSFSNLYPYPFLDVTTHGYGQIMLNIVGLSIAFICIGLVLVGIGRVLSSRTT